MNLDLLKKDDEDDDDDEVDEDENIFCLDEHLSCVILVKS